MKDYSVNRRTFLTSGTATAIGLGVTASSADESTTHRSRHTQDEEGVICHPDAYPSALMQGFPPPKENRVTLENWADTTDTVRWAYSNPARVFKSVPIEAAGTPIWVLPRAMLSPEVVNRARVLWGAPPGRAAEITVAEWLRRTETDGFLVLHDGHIVCEQYFGQTTSGTQRDLASGTKGFLASILAPYLSNRAIDEQALVTDYLPEFGDTGWAGASVRHVLDQTTGVSRTFQSGGWLNRQPPHVRDEWTWGTSAMRHADNELARQFRAAGRFPRLPHEAPDAPFMDYLLTMKQEYKHGEFFNYSAANAGVLQLILERTTRTSYFEHLSEHWRNLGAERCATLMIDHAGCAASQSGMACTVRDWARWGQMLCSGGRVGCGRVLPGIADLVSDIQRNPGPERWDEDTRKGSLAGMGYRSHLFTMPARPGDPPILASVGGYQQHCLIDPPRKNVVVQVASLADWSVGAHAQAALQCFMLQTLPQLLQQES